MKIPLTLKRIIEAKVRPRPRKETEELVDRACGKVIKAHKLTAKVARMRKLRDELLRLQDDLSVVGVYVYQDRIDTCNAEAFRAAGGVFPPAGGPAAVINQLAAATPEEGRAILKNYGINWS